MRGAVLFVLFALSFPTRPQAPEKLVLPVSQTNDRHAAVEGVLSIPQPAGERLPAVLIITSSPGFDGRSTFYAEALNAAGIATLEADLFQGRGLPRSPRENLPHAYTALRYLAAQPRVDGTRVGIMGFSWGGIVALLAASDPLSAEYARGPLRFAAHLGLYPICWRHHGIVIGGRGTWKDLQPAIYRKVTGAPVHILAGAKDDYDGPQACQDFLAALPPGVRERFSLTVYPDATFGWDHRFSFRPWEAGGNQGRGGFVDNTPNPEVAARSREFAVEYFSKHLR